MPTVSEKHPQRKVASISSFVVLKKLLDGTSQSDVGRETGLTKQRINQIASAARAAGFDLPKNDSSHRRMKGNLE